MTSYLFFQSTKQIHVIIRNNFQGVASIPPFDFPVLIVSEGRSGSSLFADFIYSFPGKEKDIYFNNIINKL